MRRRGNYWRLYTYVGKEYILSFIVAFIFFFFIFFINQILVLAQKILLKNVNSMVIGNLSSQNEILALRSSGVHIRKLFMPILVISLFFSFGTLMIADQMIPYTTELYKELYAKILQSVPTLELDSYSSTRFGKRIISNGLVEGNTLYDVVIFDNTDSRDSRVISASRGSITVIDIDRFLYRIDLDDPEIMITDSTSLESYSLARASAMSLYLDLSSTASGMVNITPSQMSIRQLLAAAEDRLAEQTSIENQRQNNISYHAQELGETLYAMEKGSNGDVDNALYEAEDLAYAIRTQGFSFYYQYYRSELQKKIALSLACTFLVFIAFPISFFRVRNGRLLGFAMSMFVAVGYWFFIYYMHVRAIQSALHPAVFMWLPNLVVFSLGLFLLWRTRK
jgi:lipopolysaccharide export system permease protein